MHRLDVIASKLDEKYDNAPEIPGFSHNEQKNREELDKLADQLKTTCVELKYIQTKDVKRHVVEYLAKKKRKRKTNSRKDKNKLGSEPKRPCFNNREGNIRFDSIYLDFIGFCYCNFSHVSPEGSIQHSFKNS